MPSGAPVWLPEFCRPGALFAVVVLAQVVALLILFAPVGPLPDLGRVGAVSLYVQWIALLIAAVACLARRQLQALPVGLGVLLLLLLIAAIAGGMAALIHWFDKTMALALTPDVSVLHFVIATIGIGCLVMLAALRYWWMQAEWQRQHAAEAEARVLALQARIRPHFLFNSLNSIAGLVHEDPDLAESAVEDLADLFRSALQQGEQLVPFANEWEVVQRYLRLESLRLGSRLQVQVDLQELPPGLLVPPLSLQPLIENAIYHGIANCENGGLLQFDCEQEADRVLLRVRNPVAPTRGTQPGRFRHGMALDNIRQRLALLYGRDARLVTSGDAAQFGYRLVEATGASHCQRRVHRAVQGRRCHAIGSQ